MDDAGDLAIRIVRSQKRRKTIGAKIVGNKLVVHLPMGLSKEEERGWVGKMMKLANDHRKKHLLGRSDNALARRAEDLSRRYFGGNLTINSVRYVTNQRKSYGSCTPSKRSIRLSRRLAEMPDWVRDYVLVHELAHLRVPRHTKEFWELVYRYKYAERARGYLIAKGMED